MTLQNMNVRIYGEIRIGYAQDGVIESLRGGNGTDVFLQKDKKDKLFDIA